MLRQAPSAVDRSQRHDFNVHRSTLAAARGRLPESMIWAKLRGFANNDHIGPPLRAGINAGGN